MLMIKKQNPSFLQGFLNYGHIIKGTLFQITNHIELWEKSFLNHGRSTLLNNTVLSSGQRFANSITNSFFHFPSSNILFSVVSIKMVVVFPNQYITRKKLTRFIEVVEHLSAPLWWNVIKSKYKSAKVWVHK